MTRCQICGAKTAAHGKHWARLCVTHWQELAAHNWKELVRKWPPLDKRFQC